MCYKSTFFFSFFFVEYFKGLIIPEMKCCWFPSRSAFYFAPRRFVLDNGYPHDGADKDSYPHDSNNQCIILRLQLSFAMINVQLMLV